MCTWKGEGLILAGDISSFWEITAGKVGIHDLNSSYSFVSTTSPKFSEEIVF